MNTTKAEQEAFYYAHHPKRLFLKYDNIYEAIWLGFIDKSPEEYDVVDIKAPETEITDNTRKGVSGSYSYENEVIKINPEEGGDQFTNFHEHLHWQRVGNSPFELKDYYNYKVSEMLDNLNNELSKPHELVVHGLTAGKKLGIIPFSKYPGDCEVIYTLHNLYDIDSWTLDLKCKSSENLKNIWKILTGNYLY